MWHPSWDDIRSRTLARMIFVLLGTLWAVRSVQSFTEPNFTDPESAADWLAVVSVSLGLALIPAGIALLVGPGRLGNRTPRVLLLLASLGAASAAIANIVEDGLGVAAAGSVYYGSILLLLVTMLALAGVLVARSPHWPGGVVLTTLVGMVLLESGGGVLILLVWGAAAIALRPRVSR